MRTLRTSEAAAYLNVSATTLRSWEERFGYPRPERSAGRQRVYAFLELFALREALSDGLHVASAISTARETVAADEHTLTAALLSFDYAGADRAMEVALSLRTFERSVMQLLLPAMEQIHGKHGTSSAPWAFAGRWADEWLSRAERLASPATGSAGVLFADCFCSRVDVDAICARALEVFCVRAGLGALRLPVRANRCLERATSAFAPRVLVLTGRAASDDEALSFARFVRSHSASLACVQYRRQGLRWAEYDPLSASPLVARNQILERLGQGHECPPQRKGTRRID